MVGVPKFPGIGRSYDMTRPTEDGEFTALALGGTRSQKVQRLQFGIGGVLLMVLLVGLASVVKTRATEAEANAVPEAVPTVQPATETPQADPLVEAGVVPDMPSEQPTPAPSLSPAPVPEQGAGNGQAGGN
ncbi:hypothetical protein E3U23_00345 [Erythrobacter litoralis]|uniref:hypothetical protein n=1 Tax=Erythrobacter litoralis TaxID=39960 RepID=UPI002436004D|nr:hypothetical protein [Erythrobacter litoralis]MDG6077647.1 hypothetical protein [Erythrobacter litoralis]